MRSFFTMMVLAIGLTAGLAATASAEAPPAPAPTRVTELPLCVIYGDRQRPMASYILTRSGQRYEVRDLRTSFVREVVRSVDGETF